MICGNKSSVKEMTSQIHKKGKFLQSKLNNIFSDEFADKCALKNESHIYYMPKPVLGKSQRSDWFFLSRDFAISTVSVETVQAVYFCFGAKPANS